MMCLGHLGFVFVHKASLWKLLLKVVFGGRFELLVVFGF